MITETGKLVSFNTHTDPKEATKPTPGSRVTVKASESGTVIVEWIEDKQKHVQIFMLNGAVLDYVFEKSSSPMGDTSD